MVKDAGYCAVTQAGLWYGGDSNLGMCPETCGNSACPGNTCNEVAGIKNTFDYTCEMVADNGYCGFTQTDVWEFGDTNMGMCPKTCANPACECYEDPLRENTYGYTCAQVAAAGYCLFTEAELWDISDSNFEMCPVSCGKEGCGAPCIELPSVENSFTYTCAAVAEAGYCGFTQAGLWVGGDTNMGMCPISCGSPACTCTENAAIQNKYDKTCEDVADESYCGYTEPGLWGANFSSNAAMCAHIEHARSAPPASGRRAGPRNAREQLGARA
jgi:hypothetical protein